MSVCDVCKDTHRMVLHESTGESRDVMCTACPVPCQLCRAVVNNVRKALSALGHVNTVAEAGTIWNCQPGVVAVFALWGRSFDTSKEGWLVLFDNGDVAFENREVHGSIDLAAIKAARAVTYGKIRKLE